MRKPKTWDLELTISQYPNYNTFNKVKKKRKTNGIKKTKSNVCDSNSKNILFL